MSKPTGFMSANDMIKDVSNEVGGGTDGILLADVKKNFNAKSKKDVESLLTDFGIEFVSGSTIVISDLK